MDLTPVSQRYVYDNMLKTKYVIVKSAMEIRGYDGNIESFVTNPMDLFGDQLVDIDMLMVVFTNHLEHVNTYFQRKLIEKRHGCKFPSDQSLDQSVEPFYGLVFRRVAVGKRNYVYVSYLTTPFVPRYTFDLREFNCCCSCLNVINCCPLAVCGVCETVLCIDCTQQHVGRTCGCGELLPAVKYYKPGDDRWSVVEITSVSEYIHHLPVMNKSVYALDPITLMFGSGQV